MRAYRQNQHLKIPGTLVNHFNKGELIILDVRTPPEFIHGHIEGSRNIPFDQLELFYKEVQPSDKPIVVVSSEGCSRSEYACLKLKEQGFQTIDGGNWEEVKEILGDNQ